MLNRRSVLSAALATPLVSFATPLRADDDLKVRDLYGKDERVSETALSLVGQRIAIKGFMAPPLKADSKFFVLTQRPMSVCPFCESAADWPADIIAVYTKRSFRVVPFNVRIETTGILEMGEYLDPETGFVSMVRLVQASYR